ncbi:MAG: [protein-PII] uridylyltransferase, partial [Bdellovibrionota bacterium]
LQELGTPGQESVAVAPFRVKASEPIAVTGKNYLQEMRERICLAHHQGAAGRPVARALSRALDNVVCALFDAAVEEAASRRKTPPPVSLVAVGGYGRGELAPYSDVDILFLHDGKSQGLASQIAEKVLYGLWDLGLQVGHSVRTVPDCVRFAEEDDTIRTAMLDARLVRGSEAPWKLFQKEISGKALRRRPQDYIEARLEHVRQRHSKAGESVYLLEPNVKEGQGGLRDFQTILWIGQVKFGVSEIEGLHQLGFLNRDELAQFNRYFDFLTRVRHELHFQSAAKQDRLEFELQPRVAAVMGFSDDSPDRAAERFMRRYYLLTRAASQLTQLMLERMKEYGRPGSRLPFAWRRPRNVGDGFQVSDGKISTTDPELFAREPHLMMRIFERAQELNAEISPRTREHLYLHRHLAGESFLKDPRVHESFRKIVGRPKGIGRTLSVMHDLRFLSRYMPEWRTVTCHVQHDAYHLHTTDIHTLFAVQDLEDILEGRLAKELPLPTAIGQQVERHHVLFLGLLLHDVGKNMGGNHSEKGAARARDICARMGLSAEDAADVEWLVRQHLILSHIALKRDLNDPKQISTLASLCGTRERLEMLHLLTTSDMRAVGPDVWTPWKGALMDEAYHLAKFAIEHGRIDRADLAALAKERIEQAVGALRDRYSEELLRQELALFPGRYFLSNSVDRVQEHLDLILSHGEFHPQAGNLRDFSNTPVRVARKSLQGSGLYEMVIYSLDMQGFFSNVAGVFASHGLSIVSAEITTLRDGTVLDVFRVEDVYRRFEEVPSRWVDLERDLADVLQRRVRVDSLIERASQPFGIDRFSAQYPTRISFDNESSEKYTIIDVVTGDRIGLLYRLTGAISRLGLTITLAKISTKKDRADDTFYVVDIFGHKVKDPAKLSRIEATLRQAIGGTALPAPADAPAAREERPGTAGPAA